VAEEHFAVTYAGPALDAGRMRVSELAPALLALANAVKEAQSLLAADQAPIALDIKASPREGSFIVDLVLADAVSFYDRVVDLFAGRDANAAVNLGSFLGWVIGGGLLIKRLAGKKVRKESTVEGQTTLELSDGTRIITAAQSVTLFRSVAFRSSMRDVVAPVGLEGVDLLRIDHREDALTVASDEVACFDVPSVPEEEILDNEREVNLHLLNVAFEHGKWRVSDGTIAFFATFADEEFLGRIARNEAQFASGDRLRVMLRTRQFQTDDGLRSEYTVTRVIEHIQGGRQLPLDFEVGSDE